MLTDTVDSQFKVGQVWHYKTRPSETASTFTIVKVEHHPKLGNIIHISVKGLRMKNSVDANNFNEVISHMPMEEKAVKNSVTEQAGERPDLSGYMEGYRTWRAAFDRGEAGVWSLPVADCIEAMEHVMNK